MDYVPENDDKIEAYDPKEFKILFHDNGNYIRNNSLRNIEIECGGRKLVYNNIEDLFAALNR